jgi:hypothetical protein
MTITQQALAKIQPPPGAPASAWAVRISACWQASVKAILEVGRLLSEAKAALPHGAFGAMIESDLPFTARTAQMLMAISADPQISNPKFISHLPANWGALYDLSTLNLNEEQFEEGITKGVIAPDAERKPLINGARAIMGSRQEPDDSLDYFPTPPWATRALIERVLPVIGVNSLGSVWEPACGEGHIAEVLREYVPVVHATDIHDYGYGDIFDYLGDEHDPDDVTGVRWIITNPPFDEKALEFALRSFLHAGDGVALFVRWQWIETVGRYEKLFKPWPPTLVCPFAERVPLCKGGWKPDGSTATAYCWVVWHRNSPSWGMGLPTLLHWIPPGCREQLTKPDDGERFTAHPVIRSPMTDDSTSAHSLSLEPNTSQLERPGEALHPNGNLTVSDTRCETGAPGRSSLADVGVS